jgi:hypothetical protein
MMRKLRPYVEDADALTMKIVKDAGGTAMSDGRWALQPADPQGDDETQEAFKARIEEFRDKVQQLNDDLKEVDDTEIEVEGVTPVPWSMFDDRPGTPEDKKQTFNANWFADADPFITME